MATEPEDAGHPAVPGDLLELHQWLEYSGERSFTEADHGPGPEQASSLAEQDTDE